MLTSDVLLDVCSLRPTTVIRNELSEFCEAKCASSVQNESVLFIVQGVDDPSKDTKVKI